MRVPPNVDPVDSYGRLIVYRLAASSQPLWLETSWTRMGAVLFSSFLVEWGFNRSSIDTCLYTFTTGGAILWVLVDDAAIADSDPALRDRFISDLGRRFPVDDRGELGWMLGALHL
jgi:hypothetical protein